MLRNAVRAAAGRLGYALTGFLGRCSAHVEKGLHFESGVGNGSHALDRSRLGMKPKLAALAAGSKVNHS